MVYAIATPNVLQVLTATSLPDLVTKVINVFLSAGWTVDGTITGGKRLLGTSPQGYLVFCDIWRDATAGPFGSPTFVLQLHSAVGSGTSGYPHQLHFDASWTYQVIAYPCGFSICVPALDESTSGSAIIGGIPSVATGCGLATAAPVTEVWFSFGDYVGDIFNFAANPRVQLGVARGGNQTGCINGVMASMSGGPGGAWDVPELLRFSSAAPDSSFSTIFDSHPLWYGEAPLTYPAFVSWPDSHAANIQIRAQMFNAAVRSATSIKNQFQTFDGRNWINYTSSYFFGALWLLRDAGSVSRLGNYHY